MVFSAAEIAIVLLVVWTASSFVPFVPSGVLAALTVIGYTYTTGFRAEPSLTVLLALVLVSLLASAVELLSGMLSGSSVAHRRGPSPSARWLASCCCS